MTALPGRPVRTARGRLLRRLDLGEQIRDLERKLAGDPQRAEACAWVLERARRLHAQAPGDTDKLYSFHAPEVACLGKGKARSPLRVRVKTSVATTNARARAASSCSER